LEHEVKVTKVETSAEVLSYFSAVVSTLADGIHAVSIERANRSEEENEREGDSLKDLKRTFFRTINDSLTDVSFLLFLLFLFYLLPVTSNFVFPVFFRPNFGLKFP
jgi:hypothetical protein